MDFSIDKSRKEIQKAVREFAKGKFEKETILELLRNREFPLQIWQEAADLGFFGIHFPEEYDGGGLDLFDYVLAAEQMCRQDSAAGIALMMAGFGAECLFRFGGGPMAEKYLPGMTAGKMRSGAALFETPGGYDPAGIATTAVKEDRFWILNGAKKYVPNGASAGFYVVLCNTDPKTPGRELSLIVADAGSAGINANPTGPSLGAGLIDFAHVTFDNVRVPEAGLLGKTGGGHRQARSFMDESRIQIASMALGTAQGAYERALDYVRQRKQFGKKLTDFQITRHKLADMAARIDAARWAVYRTAAAFDAGKCDASTAAQAKLTAASAAMAVTDEAVQLLGGYGYMTEYEIEHFYRDARTLEIFMGPPGVLKDDIAGGLVDRRR